VSSVWVADNAANPHVHGLGVDPHMHTDERTATRVRLLHGIFEQQARVTPTAIALEVPPAHAGAPRRQLTYAQTDGAAEALAGRREWHRSGCARRLWFTSSTRRAPRGRPRG